MWPPRERRPLSSTRLRLTFSGGPIHQQVELSFWALGAWKVTNRALALRPRASFKAVNSEERNITPSKLRARPAQSDARIVW